MYAFYEHAAVRTMNWMRPLRTSRIETSTSISAPSGMSGSIASQSAATTAAFAAVTPISRSQCACEALVFRGGLRNRRQTWASLGSGPALGQPWVSLGPAEALTAYRGTKAKSGWREAGSAASPICPSLSEAKGSLPVASHSKLTPCLRQSDKPPEIWFTCVNELMQPRL